jgi:hypothetical protein
MDIHLADWIFEARRSADAAAAGLLGQTVGGWARAAESAE